MSPAQLDEAFGALCEDHYRVCLGLPSPQAHHDADGNVPITERIMMQVWEKCGQSVEESVGWPAASLHLQGHDRDGPSWKAWHTFRQGERAVGSGFCKFAMGALHSSLDRLLKKLFHSNACHNLPPLLRPPSVM